MKAATSYFLSDVAWSFLFAVWLKPRCAEKQRTTPTITGAIVDWVFIKAFLVFSVLPLYRYYLEVPPLSEPVGALVFRWWRMLRTASAWPSGGILSEADGLVSHVVARYCSRGAGT